MRHAKSYARREPTREPYDYVLIVCEGSKTEPAYFGRLKEVHRLSNANVHISRPNASDPMSLVRYAEDLIVQRGYDKVYCVFDRDGHATYQPALTHIAARYGANGQLRAVTSNPCFEIWILLHYRYTSAPFNRVGRRSACDQVLAEVKNHFAGYSKGHAGVYDHLAGRMGNATMHAVQLLRENARTGSTNPATQVHQLVQYLCNLKK